MCYGQGDRRREIPNCILIDLSAVHPFVKHHHMAMSLLLKMEMEPSLGIHYKRKPYRGEYIAVFFLSPLFFDDSAKLVQSCTVVLLVLD